MLHAVAVLAIVEALIFDLRAALGDAVKTQGAQLVDREVGQPLGFDHRPVALVLAVAQYPHRFPTIEVIGVADLDAVVPHLEHGVGRLAIKTRVHGDGQLGKVLFQSRHQRQSYRLGLMQERGR